jgi:hypothetical protein
VHPLEPKAQLQNSHKLWYLGLHCTRSFIKSRFFIWSRYMVLWNSSMRINIRVRLLYFTTFIAHCHLRIKKILHILTTGSQNAKLRCPEDCDKATERSSLKHICIWAEFENHSSWYETAQILFRKSTGLWPRIDN